MVTVTDTRHCQARAESPVKVTMGHGRRRGGTVAQS